MLTSAIVGLCLFWAMVWWFSRPNRGDMDKIPGANLSVLDVLFGQKRDPRKNHVYFSELKDKYGPIFKISLGGRQLLILSDYKSIYQALVTSAKQFGGRGTSFHSQEALKDTGILISYNPDDTWRQLRKISQKHLRQFGDGMSKLETVITDVAEDMFQAFEKNVDKPFDPKDAIFDTALNSIAFLITGERSHSGDPIVEAMREYEDLFLKSQPSFAPKYFQLLNIMPWLKHIGFMRWKPFNRFCQLQSEVWDMVKKTTESNPEANNICKVLCEHVQSTGFSITETDAQMTSLSLLFAGVTTTSNTFVAAVNVLAHRKNIQDKLYSECQRIMDQKGRVPTLADRPNMPYTRAVLYELLRFTSVVAQGVGHRTLQDTELQGYKIPANTDFLTSLWNLHHDESFWGNPHEFQPERYLDDEGEVVPADHPNRTHLMPFGAGLRVCLGESLALARLFLWLVTLATRFDITPGPENKPGSIDPRSYYYYGVLKPNPYEVVFQHRK